MHSWLKTGSVVQESGSGFVVCSWLRLDAGPMTLGYSPHSDARWSVGDQPPPEATRGADQAERTLKQSREAMHSWLKPDRWFSVGFAILANPSLAERGWITTVART